MAKDIKYKNGDEGQNSIGDKKHKKGKSFEQRVGEIFRLKGFEVECNRKMAGRQIDVFIKKKKEIRKDPSYNFYVCECKNWDTDVGTGIIERFSIVLKAVKNDLKLKFPNCDCKGLIVSPLGFSADAYAFAENSEIMLYTYQELIYELIDFKEYLNGIFLDLEIPDFERVYVAQDIRPQSSSKSINGVKFLKRWVKNPLGNILYILGETGVGKTSLVRKLAYEMAKEFLGAPGKNKIPFLVKIDPLIKMVSLEHLIRYQLNISGIPPAKEKLFFKLLSIGDILLILDGFFDKMVTTDKKELIISTMKRLDKVSSGESKIIITSRPNYYNDITKRYQISKQKNPKSITIESIQAIDQMKGKVENSEIVYLKEFSPLQIKNYLHKTLGKDGNIYYTKIKSVSE